jgi:nucleoside-diphosphate-sugar epimerase
MTQRRVLVTGAGGFVGRSLALGFADLGWQVIGLDRAFDGGWEHQDIRQADAASKSQDIRQVAAELAEGVPQEVPGVDLVVHAAWVTTDAETLGITPAASVTLNLRPLRAVLEYTVRTRPPAFVFLSSSGVFAPGDATDGLTDADHPTGTSPYATAKRAGELLAQGTAESPQATAVHVVRLGYLFGPDELARPSRLAVSLVARWLAAARDGRPLEVRSDDPRRDWTFTSDLAAALERVVAGPPAGHPVHLGSPHVCTDSAFANLIASQVPGAEPVTVPATGPVKPPMIPSDIPALRGFSWTDPAAGLQVLLSGEVAA